MKVFPVSTQNPVGLFKAPYGLYTGYILFVGRISHVKVQLELQLHVRMQVGCKLVLMLAYEETLKESEQKYSKVHPNI